MGYFVLCSDIELDNFKKRIRGAYILVEPFGSYFKPPMTNKKYLYYLETNRNLAYSKNKYSYEESYNIFHSLISYIKTQIKESKEICLMKQLEPYSDFYNEMKQKKIIDLTTYVFDENEFKIELNVEYVFIQET